MDYFSKEEEPVISLRKEGTQPDKEFNPYIVPENSVPNRNISYSSQNQVLINYEDNVQKFQEPITDTQRDIMAKNNKDETTDITFKKTTESKHELKDLFTIDELIKESKRKDDEREKESKTIKKEAEDNSDIKESIKKNKEAEESSLASIIALAELFFPKTLKSAWTVVGFPRTSWSLLISEATPLNKRFSVPYS